MSIAPINGAPNWELASLVQEVNYKMSIFCRQKTELNVPLKPGVVSTKNMYILTHIIILAYCDDFHFLFLGMLANSNLVQTEGSKILTIKNCNLSIHKKSEKR